MEVLKVTLIFSDDGDDDAAAVVGEPKAGVCYLIINYRLFRHRQQRSCIQKFCRLICSIAIGPAVLRDE